MRRRSFLVGLPTVALMSSTSAFGRRGLLAIDTHSHVFTRDLPQAEGSRYKVNYDAPVEDYISMLDAQGMSHGVLIQPSFLGTDNSYLLAALKRFPKRLRGVVVVSSNIANETLAEMDRNNVVGIRLNLIGRPDPDWTDTAIRCHLDAVATLGWHIEIQIEAGRLPQVMPALLARGVDIVVDHFGRPSQADGVADPGFKYLLNSAATRQVWVKMSGWYRLAPGNAGEEIAAAAAGQLLKSFGAHRLTFGSDWPHTQFERVATPSMARKQFERWVPGAADRRAILGTTPRDLFRFDRHFSRRLGRSVPIAS